MTRWNSVCAVKRWGSGVKARFTAHTGGYIDGEKNTLNFVDFCLDNGEYHMQHVSNWTKLRLFGNSRKMVASPYVAAHVAR